MRKLKMVLGSLLVIVLVGGFVAFLNWGFLRFDTVIVTGETAENKEDIQAYVLGKMSGRYLWLIPKDSVFFLHKKILTQAIKLTFPRLETVQISLPELNTLKVLLEDKEARLVWCDGVNGKKSGHCYYINEIGEAYSESPNFSEAVMVEIIAPLPESLIGKKVVASGTVEKIQLLATTAERLFEKLPGKHSLKLIYWQPLSAGDWAGQVMDQGGQVWQVLFNEKSAASDLVGALGSILKNKTFLTDWSKHGGHLEYIDLRFPQKIFYRFI